MSSDLHQDSFSGPARGIVQDLERFGTLSSVGDIEPGRRRHNPRSIGTWKLHASHLQSPEVKQRYKMAVDDAQDLQAGPVPV